MKNKLDHELIFSASTNDMRSQSDRFDLSVQMLYMFIKVILMKILLYINLYC